MQLTEAAVYHRGGRRERGRVDALGVVGAQFLGRGTELGEGLRQGRRRLSQRRRRSCRCLRPRRPRTPSDTRFTFR